MKPVPVPTCEAGHPGYGVFHVDRDPGLEIQACSDCGRFRAADGSDDDDAAAVQFVRDLEMGLPYAIECACQLLSNSTILSACCCGGAACGGHAYWCALGSSMPPVLGGQGRSAWTVESDAWTMVWWCGAGFVLLMAFIILRANHVL